MHSSIGLPPPFSALQLQPKGPLSWSTKRTKKRNLFPYPITNYNIKVIPVAGIQIGKFLKQSCPFMEPWYTECELACKLSAIMLDHGKKNMVSSAHLNQAAGTLFTSMVYRQCERDAFLGI